MWIRTEQILLKLGSYYPFVAIQQQENCDMAKFVLRMTFKEVGHIIVNASE